MSEHKEYNRKKSIMIAIGYVCVALAIYYIFFRYVIYIAWPFAIAALIALITRRPVLLLHRKLHIPEKLSAAIVVVLFYLIVAGLLTFGVFKAVYAILDWSKNLPDIYTNNIEPTLSDAFNWISSHSFTVGDNIAILDNLGDTILSKLEDVMALISNKAVGVAKSIAIGVPKTILGIIFMVISSFFISMDYDRISKFFMAQFNPNQQQIIVSSKEFLGTGIGKLLISYLLIMFITFLELNIGLRILKIPNATIVSLLIAIFDILPALGTGGVVIPWIVIELISGDLKLALGLLIMYLAITVIRNIIEPKIVGENIGVHPVLMLMSIYLGAWILGPLGIIILPFTIIVLKKLNDAELVHIFKNTENANE